MRDHRERDSTRGGAPSRSARPHAGRCRPASGDSVSFTAARGEIVAITRPIDDAAIDRLLEAVDLAGYADRDVARLSGGEAQRVALVRALANQPEALLLDEPASELNQSLKLAIENLIAGAVRQSGLACVMVTYDLLQAARLAARALVVEGGRVVRSLSATELVS